MMLFFYVCGNYELWPYEDPYICHIVTLMLIKRSTVGLKKHQFRYVKLQLAVELNLDYGSFQCQSHCKSRKPSSNSCIEGLSISLHSFTLLRGCEQTYKCLI